MRMLTGTTRSPSDIVATVPPDLVDVTVEKVRHHHGDGGVPARVPTVGVLLAAVEAACTNEFNMHGLLATAMPVGPVIMCGGPGTRRSG